MSTNASAQIFAKPLQPAVLCRAVARWPTLQNAEDDQDRHCNGECQKRQRDWALQRRYGFADFDIGRSALTVSVQDAIRAEQITSKKKRERSPQKITAPTPDRREWAAVPPRTIVENF